MSPSASLPTVAAPAAAPAPAQAAAPEKTFYRRELPAHLASFTSDRGRQLFRQALLAGFAEIFFALSGNFTMQSEPAFCGLGSLVMVLNALSVDPGKKWKGVWRWFADDMLECCAPLDQIKQTGMTFDELACVARCNGLDVVAKRASSVDYDEFVRDLELVTSSSETHMVVSFSRKTLSQTGDGHFSPIGAFVPESQQVLVMDTARFKYPSYFADARLLFEAMKPIDPVTGLSRGYFLLRKGDSTPLSLCQIVVKDVEWRSFRSVFWDTLPRLLADPSVHNSAEDLIRAIVSHLPAGFADYTAFRSAGRDLAGPPGQDAALQSQLDQEIHALTEQVTAHPLFRMVHAALAENTKAGAVPLTTGVRATIFFMSLPDALWVDLPAAARSTLETLRRPQSLGARDSLLRSEVARLSAQWDTLLNSKCSCGRKDKCTGH
ncbi:hypothetical protein HK105_200784 [Polyrhizophydium stewartii]|uniref:glutathione gamma-glutamylcysteinyltransferase n=1 Tax=Polyrhizophydium stewartii TaxID=2732419 RepID=A0ABR4NK06_9FUNG|nr:hypothetical protein HK105_000395 [Polyrhizophydium stewartii]